MKTEKSVISSNGSVFKHLDKYYTIVYHFVFYHRHKTMLIVAVLVLLGAATAFFH